MPNTLKERIAEHGRKLLKIFPNALDRDPVSLCKRLRKIEAKGTAFALRLCNGPDFTTPEAADRSGERILTEARKLLGDGPPIFLNRDPRGYALKIDDEDVRTGRLDIATDWGGYGLIAPDLREGY